MAFRGKLPNWASDFLEIGRRFADDSDFLSPEFKITIALCVPRLNFVANLLALGMLDWRSEKRDDPNDLRFYQGLIGKWVAFKNKQNKLFKGIVRSVPNSGEDNTGELFNTHIEIIIHQGDPDGKSKLISSSHWVDPKYWHTIQPIADPGNLSLATNKTFGKGSKRSIKEKQIVQELFEGVQADWITDVNAIVGTILGNKKRLTEELSEPLPLLNSGLSLSLRSIIRPSGQSEFEGSTHFRIVSGSKGKGSQLIDCKYAILEASRSIHDQIKLTRELSRVVILDRSSHGYKEMAEAVLENHRNRKEDFLFDFKINPVSVTILSYVHHVL